MMDNYIISTTTLTAPTIPNVRVMVRSWDDGSFTVEWESDVPMPEQVITCLDGGTKDIVHYYLEMALSAVAILANCASKDYERTMGEMWDVVMANALGECLDVVEY